MYLSNKLKKKEDAEAPFIQLIEDTVTESFATTLLSPPVTFSDCIFD